MSELSEEAINNLFKFQRNEITEGTVYRRLASIEKNKENKDVLIQIAEAEDKHYLDLKNFTHKDVGPNKWLVAKYYWMARLLGSTFTVKLMESEGNNAHSIYSNHMENEDLQRMARDEEAYESKLISLINEERLYYMGSVVLGLNDALVEFTGALAGFTLALSDHRLIALTGSITGIAAALSMASSEYLSTKSEGGKTKHPAKAAIYTGIAYLITVTALVTPFILMQNVLQAMCVMLLMALIIIALFNYYYAVARSESFKKRFVEMAVLSFSVAGISFLIGYLLNVFTGITT